MLKLASSKRSADTKVKKLRRDGLVPAVIYGKNLDASISIQIDAKTLSTNAKDLTIGAQLALTVDDEPYNVMIKKIDFIHMSRKIQHLDLQVLTSGEKIKTTVAINFINRDNIKEEGNVQEYLSHIEYEVLPKDMLESVDVDLSTLTIAHDIKIEDIDFAKDERYHMITAANTTIVSLAPIQEVVLETEDTAQVLAEVAEEVAE